MIPRTTRNSVATASSRNVLRVLRNLALAGSTLGTFCAATAVTYDIHRQVRVAERVVENKRTIQTSAPQYDATAAARRLARMMEAAETGEFMGIDSLKGDDLRSRRKKMTEVRSQGGTRNVEATANASSTGWQSSSWQESFARFSRLNKGPSARPPNALPARAPELLDKSLILRTAQPPKIHLHSPTDVARDVSSKDTPTVPEQMKRLLDEDRPIEAAQLFLDTYSRNIKGMSSGMRELTLQTFYVNCKQENVFIARSVFLRLNDVDEVSLMMWEVLMFALAKKGCIESVSTLFIQFKNKFHVRPILLDILIRCLVESRKLSEARALLFRNLRHDRDCGLCGAYLAGLWRKTRSIELLNGQLGKLLSVLPRAGKTVSDKLFNPVIKAYIEFGKFAEAEALVNLMSTKYNIPLRCRTKGLLVYGKSLSGDWKGVEQGLQEMYDSKMIMKTHDFIQIFDRIFLEYWVSHTGQEIHDFLYYYIEKFRLVPDRVLYKHVLEAFVEKGDEGMVTEFTAMARERAWKIQFNEQQFLDLLRSRRLALEQSPVGLWQMLQAARMKHGQSTTSRRIFGYDQRSFPNTDVNRMPFTGSRLPWYDRTVQEITAPRRADSYQKLEQNMAYHIGVGKIADALACFETAKESGFHMRQHHLELAVIAMVLQYGPSVAKSFIAAESKHINSSFKQYPELFRHIMDGSSTTEEELIKMTVLHFYEVSSTTKNLRPKHHITTTTSHRLILAGKAHLALDLLTAVYMSQYRHVADITSIYMKMFLRAFGNTGNLQGVRWSILTALSGSIKTRWDFIAEARTVLARLKTPTNGFSDVKLEYLNHITDLLKKKCQGDEGIQQFHSHKHLKRQSRQKLKIPADEKLLFKQLDVLPTIESWDEEYELMAALGRLEGQSDLLELLQASA